MNWKLSGWVLIFLTLVSSLFFNLKNHSVMEKEGISLRHGISIITTDDASYLNPPENFLSIGQWKDNFPGRAACYQRSPGYGFIYLFFRSFFTEKTAIVFLAGLQVLLFAVSILAFWKCLSFLIINEKLGFVLALFAGISPFLHGFLFYTITEGITPALVMIFLYFLCRICRDGNKIWWMGAAILLGSLILIRPVLLVFIISILIIWFFGKWWNRKPGFIYFLILLTIAPFLVWQIRNYGIAGEWVGFHPIYDKENTSIFRPSHQAIWNFHKSWGQKGNEFHQTLVPLWESAINGDTTFQEIQKVIKVIPENVKEIIPEKRLVSAYRDYQNFILSTAEYYHNELPHPAYIPEEEKEVIENFRSFAKEYRQERFWHSNVVVPAGVYYELAAHSNLSLYIFQKAWRGKWWMEWVRTGYGIIHFGIFLLFPFMFFTTFKNRFILATGLPVMLYLAFLIFVQRGVEERYTLPVLLPMMLVVIYGIYDVARQYKKSTPKGAFPTQRLTTN